jgi:hypothetical protein
LRRKELRDAAAHSVTYDTRVFDAKLVQQFDDALGV